MNNSSLQDQVVMMVGAGRPPAPALAQALAQQGAILAVNDLSPVLLDPLVKTVRDQGGRIEAYVADATRGMPLRAMIDAVLSDWGRIDILINNPRIQPQADLFHMDEWDWQRTIEMNLNGPFLVTQLVARMMQEQGQGVILNLVDTNAPILDMPGLAAYAASQQGLLALSRASARELIAYNIRVYTLCPEAAVLDAGGSGQALGDLAVYLCGPEAARLTGQIFQVSQTTVTPPVGNSKG